jgi:soluble lytic murein transglycosylase-like protein
MARTSQGWGAGYREGEVLPTSPSSGGQELKNYDDRYDSLIQYYAWLNNLDWLQVKAQIKQESNFDPRAVSSAGAKGLGQFMPPTWKEWSGDSDPFNPELSISATCRYMRWQLKQFNQDLRLALAAYNWGIGNVRRVVRDYGSTWLQHAPDETIKYIRRINENYNNYMRGINDD